MCTYDFYGCTDIKVYDCWSFHFNMPLLTINTYRYYKSKCCSFIILMIGERCFVMVMLVRNEALPISIERFMGPAFLKTVKKQSCPNHSQFLSASADISIHFRSLRAIYKNIGFYVNTLYKHSPVSLYFHIKIIKFGKCFMWMELFSFCCHHIEQVQLLSCN